MGVKDIGLSVGLSSKPGWGWHKRHKIRPPIGGAVITWEAKGLFD